MARTSAAPPGGGRVTDNIGLRVLSVTVPRLLIDAVLAETGRRS